MEDASLIMNILMVLGNSLAYVTLVTMELSANLMSTNAYLRRVLMAHVRMKYPDFLARAILDILVFFAMLISMNVFQVHVFQGYNVMTKLMDINVDPAQKGIMVLEKHVTESMRVSILFSTFTLHLKTFHISKMTADMVYFLLCSLIVFLVLLSKILM